VRRPTPLPTLPRGYAVQYSRTPWHIRVAAFLSDLVKAVAGH
jgi:hypothetical protein